MGIPHIEVFPMKSKEEQDRILAVERYHNGEKPASICASFGKSKTWLYKWVKRQENLDNEESWNCDRSRRPLENSNSIPCEIEERVKRVRLDLCDRNLFHGAQAILWELEDRRIKPLPSLRTINRILARKDLIRRRTGRYEPKGTRYPVLPFALPNDTHQADLVGPCYLKGPVRFYSLNVVDLATARCGLYPSVTKGAEGIMNGLWDVWKRLGIPDRIQVDNALTFAGSPKYPRSMGPIIRLCLHNRVEPWFIPQSEPWRNGTVEKFNDLYQKNFLGKMDMSSLEDLKIRSLIFENRHNTSYRYSKLRGKTPVKELVTKGTNLRFPDPEEPFGDWRKKPEKGRYHLVRLIRSDLKLNIFGEIFSVPSELKLEYVVATIDVKVQKLTIYHDKKKVEQFDYIQ
jgi:hypothetical protein